MRVFHIASGLDRRSGGVAAAVMGLAIAQAKAGFDVGVLSTFAPGENLDAVTDLKTAGVDVKTIGPASRRGGWHGDNRSASAEAVKSADIIHVHGVWEDLQHRAMRAAQQAGVPYVIAPHGMLATWSLQQRALKKRIYLALRLKRNLNRASAIHYTTQEEARQAQPLKIQAPLLVESLGLDLQEFHTLPPAGSFRERFPQIGGKPFVLFMSRLHEKKGLDLLIPAFAKANLPDAMLVIAGPDQSGYLPTVQRLIDENHLQNRTVLPGMLWGQDRVAALADADLFVLPSYQENFGIVVPEALAAGTPVIISDQVNFSEHLTNQNVGEVVPCDIDRLASAIHNWMTDPARRASASAQARQFVMNQFDALSIAERWKSHYSAVIERRRTAR